MIVKDERDTYAQHYTDYDRFEASCSSTPQPFFTEGLQAFANHVHPRSDCMIQMYITNYKHI